MCSGHEILVVEDSPADRRLLHEAFQKLSLPHRVHYVSDGKEALSYLLKTGPYEGAARPSIVILDLNLPGHDGKEILSFIRSNPTIAEIPVIMLTTSDAIEDINSCYKAGANCYLVKSSTLEEVVAMIKSVGDFWLGLTRLPAIGSD